jgi:hypothetical protein
MEYKKLWKLYNCDINLFNFIYGIYHFVCFLLGLFQSTELAPTKDS